MAHFIFNALQCDAGTVAALLRSGVWPVATEERHAEALAAGDAVLVYLGAPQREFVARVELASGVRDLGDSGSGVLLAGVEEWDPPVPMGAVLAEIGPSDKTKADFDTGIVGITAYEYEAALAVAARRGGADASSTGTSQGGRRRRDEASSTGRA